MAVLNYKKQQRRFHNMKKGLVLPTETLVYIGIAAILALLVIALVLRVIGSVGGS